MVNEEHLPEVNRRIDTVMKALLNIERIADWKDEEPIYDSAGYTEEDRKNESDF